ncbi:peptidase inhibitor family I36 protein [Nonomuraea sp. NPDC055795]
MNLRRILGRVAVGMTIAVIAQVSLTSTAFADSSCDVGEFCDWSKANYKGTKGISAALADHCYSGFPSRSVKNRTSRLVALYRTSSTCSGGDVVLVARGDW